MIQVSIIKRTLREGRTYDDFREAWYHAVGFGATNRMLTSLNVANPREVIVIGLTELTTLEQASSLIAIDAKERQEHPLDDIVEPDIQRTFGILVSEDDFSGAGEIEFKPATVNGELTDMAAVEGALRTGAELLAGFIHCNEDM
jgi:hypothetical protein